MLLMIDPRTVEPTTQAADAATDIAALLVVRETTAAAALLDPLRLQMLHMLEQPDSASGLARRLGLPRQKINYHVRELERHGFVRTLSQRRKGNCVERVVQSVARTFAIGPEALGPLAPHDACAPFTAGN